MSRPTPHPRRRLAGLPALLVAVLALVVALGGTATAAAMITSKQIKDNTITSKDVKNGSLLLRDFKRSEAAKLRGKNGTNGASAFAPPPSGTVIKGGGVLNVQVNTANTSLRTYAPLPFTTTVPLTEVGAGRNLYFGGTSPVINAGQADTSVCPGTAAAPTAAPGRLCVYLVETQNLSAPGASLYGGTDVETDAADRSGFYIFTNSAAAGDVLVRYVWVYTAP